MSRLKQLLKQAEDFCGEDDPFWNSYDDVTELYRNKDSLYFQEVKRNNNVMKPILKDQGGDPLCPINRTLSGVFFGVTLIRGSLPTISPFGDTRIHVPILGLFNSRTNLYFADFFCVGKNGNHFVLLVITEPGSTADEFCRLSDLPWLNPATNRFLQKVGSNYRTISKYGLFVEVFYTEEVDITAVEERFGKWSVYYSKTKIYGKGHSTFGGLRKGRYCPTCNVKSIPDKPVISFRYHSGDSPRISTLKTTFKDQHAEDFKPASRKYTKPKVYQDRKTSKEFSFGCGCITVVVAAVVLAIRQYL